MTAPLSVGSPLDPRRHAHRPGLAAEALRGRVDAERFVVPTIAQIGRSAIGLRRAPAGNLPFETEALFGETVDVLDVADGWAWVQLTTDGYVGYAPEDALVPAVAATHRVKAIGTFLYGVPDIKSPPLLHLSLGARLTVIETGERFYRLAGGQFVIGRHVCDLAWRDRDFVEVAERMLGAPYLWGGRTRVGLDCSALVQLSLLACGMAAPRDSDMQQAELGSPVAIGDDYEGLARGDLVFWPGHVGIMGDAIMLLHANAHHMAVAIEPLATAAERIQAGGSDIIVIKRGVVGGGLASPV